MRRFIISFALMAPAIATSALADDPLAAGKKVFGKCKACHMIGEDAKNKVGPNLNNLIGRTAGSLPDFEYSDAMKSAGASGVIWSEETLSHYLAKPRDFVPDNKMAFSGLRKEQQIKDIIAYLASFSE